MLKRLSIHNYLLIGSLELELSPGLTIITGETGSGKSILIGALALAMGERAEAGAHRDPSARCVVELEVDTEGMDLAGWFEASEIPHDQRTILRRQLEPGGRSRAFINDTPVKLEMLRDLGERLVHVHSQHHTQLLNDTGFQLSLVDRIAGQIDAVADYATGHAAWRELQRELERLREQASRSRAELDYLMFQLTELDEAQLRPGERPTLELELARTDHADELVQGLRSVEMAMNDESGVNILLLRARQALQKPARLDPAVAALLERLNSAQIELQDIVQEADRLAGAITVDPRHADRLRERIDTLIRLEQKHRVGSTEELIALREDIRTRIAGIGSMADGITALEKRVSEAGELVLQKAGELSRNRTAAVKLLAGRIESILHDLGMPHAVFQFEHRTGEPGPTGMDTVRALFSANKDRPPAPLDRVASGGELSRVMLALISLAADSRDLPTVIFDEIDTGVSGEAADRVGSLMARMGRDRQVIAITHLPQIASKADTHLLVTKQEVAHRIGTEIRAVTADERIQALARMLSGRTLTKAALENARALLKTDRAAASS